MSVGVEPNREFLLDAQEITYEWLEFGVENWSAIAHNWIKKILLLNDNIHDEFYKTENINSNFDSLVTYNFIEPVNND